MSKVSRRMPLQLLLGAAVAAVASTTAQASLGGDVASVLRDHKALNAPHSVTPMVNYDLHEGTTADGLVLHEYVDHRGQVFAVSWNGKRSPDIAALLGEHADKLQQAAQAHRGTRHFLSVNSADLVVSVTRLPRGWQGQAYLPASIPAGVSRAELR